MPAAPRSPNEERRLSAVKRLRLLGTPAEERFDAITRMARSQFDVPLACLDIVGDKLVWLKSVQGFDGLIGMRKDSYCHYTVLDDGVCLIRDARQDPRVHDSILADAWVFYAGVPLHFEGERVGVLCIGDGKTREFTASQFNQLMSMAALAERELHNTALSEAQSALPESDDELEVADRIDLLTHIWNRKAILDLALRELRQAEIGHPLALLMIRANDLDWIDREFDSGSDDQVLRAVAERLRATLRPADAVGRYDRDTFLAVLAGAGAREVQLISERLRIAVAEAPVQFGRHAIPVTCSIGQAITTGSSGDTVDSLIAQAAKPEPALSPG